MRRCTCGSARKEGQLLSPRGSRALTLVALERQGVRLAALPWRRARGGAAAEPSFGWARPHPCRPGAHVPVRRHRPPP